eukprot:scaffold222632_cov13-Tisochrysis_lutea.AAC.1
MKNVEEGRRCLCFSSEMRTGWTGHGNAVLTRIDGGQMGLGTAGADGKGKQDRKGQSVLRK